MGKQLTIMHETTEALFNVEPVLTIGRDLIDWLKTRALTAPRGRFRFCLHASTNDQLQQMLIASTSGAYCRPHRHPSSPATIEVLEGDLSVVIFNDDGSVNRVIDVAPQGAGKVFCAHLTKGVWHMDIVRSPYAVVLETMTGPFVRGQSNDFPGWAPAEEDRPAVLAFLKQLNEGHLVKPVVAK